MNMVAVSRVTARFDHNALYQAFKTGFYERGHQAKSSNPKSLFRKLLPFSRLEIAPKRNVSNDRDNYTIKYPAATISLLGVAVCGLILYSTRDWKMKAEENKINRMPLAERQRDPDMDVLSFKPAMYKPSDS